MMNHASTQTNESVHPLDSASLERALEHVVNASQHVITDHIDLVRLEMSEALSRTLRGVAFIVVGGVLGCFAWLGAMATIVALLATALTLPGGLAVVTVLSAGAATIFVQRGLRFVQHPVP